MTHKVPVNIFLRLLIAVTLFHMAVIAKAIPYNIAWGGRLQNDSQMYAFEAFSILINLFLGLILLMKGGYINYWFKRRTIDIILWLFLVIFILNTVGNLFAKTNFEKLFSALTLIFAILIWRILKTKQPNKTKKDEFENSVDDLVKTKKHSH